MPVSGSYPENSPSRSSGSSYASEMSVEALVYACTYSLKYSSFSSTCRITPPSSTMSVPVRIGMCRSALAEVRVNRGSTWMTREPRLRASITHWKATGWASAMFEPSMTMRSALAKSCTVFVAPPRPNEAPRLGTVAECHMRAWFSIWMAPAAVKNFLIR